MTLLKKAEKRVRIVIAASNPEIDANELFAGLPVQARSFSSGEEAYDWCSRNPDSFDFCLVGLDLCDMTGVTLAYQLRRDLATEVVILSEQPETEKTRIADYTLRAEVISVGPSTMEMIREVALQFMRTGTVCRPQKSAAVPRFEQVSRLNPGVTVRDYTLLEPVAVGGMGEVWEAYETANRSKRVALKFLSPDWRNNSRVTEMFRHEARLLSAMTNECLLPVLASGCWSSYEFIAFPFVDGVTGEQLFSEHAPLPVPIASYIGKQLFTVLEYIHTFGQLGIQHRDINPSNVLFSEAGRLFLIDFGGARSGAQKPTFDGRRVKVSVVAQGNAGYEAPEQREDPVNPRNSQLADLYSAGLVFYRALVPRLYQDEDNYQLSPLPTSLDDGQRRFFTGVLAPDPSQRFESARRAKEELCAEFSAASEDEFRSFIAGIL